MSTDYYTRLEQQRGPQPSEQMLASLARALRLTGDERDYLFQIAGHNPPAPVAAATHVAPALLRVLDRLSDTPALILSNLGETLVQNRMAERAVRRQVRLHRPGPQRDLPLVHRSGRAAALPRATTATGRAAPRSRTCAPPTGRWARGSRAGELVRALQKASPEFAALWERHEVARRFEDHKTLIHPELGPIEVDCQVLFTEDQSQALLVLTAPPRTEGYEKLQLLAVLGHQRFARADHG